jgi:hypothetical protein
LVVRILFFPRFSNSINSAPVKISLATFGTAELIAQPIRDKKREHSVHRLSFAEGRDYDSRDHLTLPESPDRFGRKADALSAKIK